MFSRSECFYHIPVRKQSIPFGVGRPIVQFSEESGVTGCYFIPCGLEFSHCEVELTLSMSQMSSEVTRFVGLLGRTQVGVLVCSGSSACSVIPILVMFPDCCYQL